MTQSSRRNAVNSSDELADLMRLGVTSYTYRWAVGGDFRFGDNFKPKKAVDVFSLVDKVSKLGLEVLQISNNVNIEMISENYTNLGETAKAKGVALQLGAEGVNTIIVSKYAEIADLIGAHLLNVYSTEREPIREVAKRIRGFLPILRDHELTLTLENEDSGIYSCYELAEVLRRVDDPLVGACIDTMNSTVILENPLETVRILTPYAVCLHLKDFNIKRTSVSGFSISGTPVGTGMLNVKTVLTTVKEAGRNPDILLEQFMGKKGNEEKTLDEEERWIKKGIKFIHSIL